MQIHELNNYTGDLDSGAYLAVDNGSDTGKVSTTELFADTNAAVSQLDTVLNGRIDNIVAGGEAPSASEIVDARYGADGVTYPSLGAAIRDQVTDLKSDLSDLSSIVGTDSTYVKRIDTLCGMYFDGEKIVKNAMNYDGLTFIIPKGKTATFAVSENFTTVRALNEKPYIGLSVQNEPVKSPYTAEDSDKYIFISFRNVDVETSYCDVFYNDSDLILDVRNLEKKINSVDFELLMINKEIEFNHVGFINSDGSINSTPNSQNTGYVDVTGYKKVTYASNLDSSALACAFYDNNKKFITGYNNGDKSEHTVDIPINASYVALSNYGTSYQKKATLIASESTFDGRIAKIERGFNLKGKNIIFFGDSITQTHNVSDDGSTHSYIIRNYPQILCEKLGCTYKNFAKDGASYRNRNLEFYQWIGNQIETCIATIPADDVDIIVVSAGTNDGIADVGDYDTAMSKSIDNLDKTKLYEALRYCYYTLRNAYPNAVIYCGIPIQRADRTIDYTLPMTTAIRKMAGYYNLLIIDGEQESGIIKDFETWLSNGRYLRDGLHPNDDGKILLANLYYRVIRDTYLIN